MAAPDYSVPSIRPGAAPTLDVVQAGLTATPTAAPVYVRLTEVLVSWLRWHFSAASRIEYPNLVGRVYTPANKESSPIVITSLAEWTPQTANKRPSVLVDRLDQERDMQTRGIGDQFQGVAPGNYQHFMIGQHVVHCIGGREGEAEYLAAEVWRDLSRFAPVARERLCLYRFLPMKIGKRVQLDEHKETYTVPVPMIYGYGEAWGVHALDEEEINAIRLRTG